MPLYTEELQSLETPIDVMFLMHKVFLLHSDKVGDLAMEAQSGGDLSDFKIALDEWLKHLFYHTLTEDEYMTGPLKDKDKELQDGRYPLRDNEKEHVDIREEGDEIRGHIKEDNSRTLPNIATSEVLAMEEENHALVMQRVKEVEEVVRELLGPDNVQSQLRRHLYKSVMALKVAEYDHFENEEAFVLPLVKEHMTIEQQSDCVRKLLYEDNSEYPRWIYDFIWDNLGDVERKLLERLGSDIGVELVG